MTVKAYTLGRDPSTAVVLRVREAQPSLRMTGRKSFRRNVMDIADWRKKIDELDRRLVELLSERARAAVEIGRLKRDTNLPIYEPERERIVFENVQEMNRGPLPGRDLVRIFERIMDVMRNIQKEENWSEGGIAKRRRRSWIRK
jgi:chorismate mutase